MTRLLERRLPANVDAERFVLGSILLHDDRCPKVSLAFGGGRFLPRKTPTNFFADGRALRTRRKNRPHDVSRRIESSASALYSSVVLALIRRISELCPKAANSRRTERGE